MDRFQSHEWVRVINVDDEPYRWQYLPTHAETIEFDNGSVPMKHTYRDDMTPEQMAKLAELWRVVCDFYLASFATVCPEHMSQERYDRLKDALRFQRDHFHETPAVIVACYELSVWTQRLQRQWRHFADAIRKLGLRRAGTLAAGLPAFSSRSEAASVYPGVQNLLLAARALGLGATLTTWHLALEAEFKTVLGIPRSVKTFAVIPVGWPLGNFGPVVRRPAADVIHRDRW